MMISMTIPTNARYSYNNGKCLLILIKWVSNSYVNLELNNLLWFWFFIYFSLSFSPLWEEGVMKINHFRTSQQQMSHIKFSPDELNIIWGDIRTVITGNAHLFVITFILTLTFLNDLEPYTQVTCELQDHQRSILFFTWFKSLTQMTKIELKTQ